MKPILLLAILLLSGCAVFDSDLKDPESPCSCYNKQPIGPTHA